MYFCPWTLKFTNINLNKFYKEQDLEVCAVKLQSSLANICILSIYRAPTGYCLYFLNGLDTILKSVYNINIEIIICGDININYLNNNNRKNNNLTLCYPLITSTVQCTFQLESKIIQFPQLITFSLIFAEVEIIP
jgi:hypothetical protein